MTQSTPCSSQVVGHTSLGDGVVVYSSEAPKVKKMKPVKSKIDKKDVKKIAKEVEKKVEA